MLNLDVSLASPLSGSKDTLRPIATAKGRPDMDQSDILPSEAKPIRKKDAKYITPADVLEDEKAVGRAAADRIMEVAKEAPDAVMVLSADSTAGLVCDALVERFKEAKDDQRVDFSKTSFFLLSGYVGLTRDHPLSQAFFMRKAFYERLKVIDPVRAPKPENIHIPFLRKNEEAEKAASRYEQALQQAVKETGRGRIDLVVSGMGSAYPEYGEGSKSLGLRGGSLSLNQPGSTPEDRTRVVKLESHIRLEIKFRAKNLRSQPGFKQDHPYKVPTDGITIGIAEILESDEILLLATGEKSAPVVKQMHEGQPTSEFPVTFLKYHKNVRWILDREAGYYLPHLRRPWEIQGTRFEWTRETMAQAVFEALADNESLAIDELTASHLQDIGVSGREINRFNFERLRGMEAIKAYLRGSLSSCLHSNGNDLLPKEGDEVMLFSPHPGDDVITMAAIIKMLAARGCKVTIAYLTSGEEAIRDNYKATKRIYGELVEEFSDKMGRPPHQSERLSLKKRARTKTRRIEAANALLRLLGPEEREKVTQEFLNLPYCEHIGFVGVKPISRKDVDAVGKLLDKINPDYIFFSAEKNPQGIHGLGTEIIARALRKRELLKQAGASKAKTPTMCGFQGAGQEWPLYQPANLVIVPFSDEEIGLKEAAIRKHFSQFYPMFPGPDTRIFWQRPGVRNRRTGRVLEQAGILKEAGYSSDQMWHAEVFRIFPYKEFLIGLEDDGVIAITEDGSSYSLTEGPDGSFTEEFRFAPGAEEPTQERIKAEVFRQLLRHPNPEIRRLILEHSKERVAWYLVGLALFCQRSGDRQKAAEYWTKALHRYLKEGQRDKAITCRRDVVSSLRSTMREFSNPLYPIKLAEHIKVNAELSEALGGEEYKNTAARRWAMASKAYNDLAKKAELKSDEYYFYRESAQCAENAARLDKELGEKKDDARGRLDSKKHQTMNMHLAALNWFLGKKYNKAIRCAGEAIMLENELGYKMFVAADLSIAANSCFYLERFKEAVKYGLSAIKLNRRLSESPDLSERERTERMMYLVMDLSLVGNCYFKLEQYDKALECYESSAILREDAGEDKDASKDWYSIVLIGVKLAESGVDKLDNYKKAGYYARRIAELAEAAGETEEAIKGYLFAAKNFDLAILPEEVEDCEEKAVGLLKGLASEIQRTDPGVTTFQTLLDEFESRHAKIFRIDTLKYLKEALRKAQFQLREEARESVRHPSVSDITEGQELLSVLATQA